MIRMEVLFSKYWLGFMEQLHPWRNNFFVYKIEIVTDMDIH